jgi:hypothetical protein
MATSSSSPAALLGHLLMLCINAFLDNHDILFTAKEEHSNGHFEK